MISLALIGTSEVAQILGVHERTALRLMQTGKIAAFRLSARGTGGRGIWRTTRAHVAYYVDQQIAKNLSTRENAGEVPFRLWALLHDPTHQK